MKPRLVYAVFLLVTLAACGSENGSGGNAVAAPAPEVIDEQALTAGCDRCHGNDGATSINGAPFLAGQHQPYLVAAIREYVVGARLHKSMRDSVVALTDAERQSVAEHYTRLDTPWKGVQQAKPATAGRIDKRAAAAGKRIARQCTSCHGGKGVSTRPGVPNLAGLQPDYFKRSLRAYLTGERQGAEIMKNFKYSLSKRDIDNLAAYFASLKPRKTALSTQGSVKWGRKTAARCVGCHGANGNSINPDIPSLAGQDGRYLKTALQHYRDGARKHAMMQQAVAGFSDKKIANLAAYYSRQRPVLPGNGGSGKPGEFDPIAGGGRLAASCDGCHGKDGNGGQPGIPRLTGLAPQYLFAAILAYRDGERDNETMRMFTRTLSDVAIEKVSLFYATREPAENTQRGKGDAAAGEAIAAACSACHGEKGISPDPKVPSLAGQDAAYLVSAIGEYASGKRPVEAMTDAVKALDKRAVRDVATWYASLSGARPTVRLPESPANWAMKCDRCHGPGGYGEQPDKPIIAGQLQPYLVKSLIAYRDGTRRHSMMNAMLADISLSEIDALAAHYARQGWPEKKADNRK